VKLLVFPQIGEFAGATYTPMSEDGLTVNLEAIGHYASFLSSRGLNVVFINGTSGESMSLSEAERKAVTERWVEEGKKQSPRIRVIAHVGSDSLSATRELARHAEEVGVDAISAMTPIMFKPANVMDLAQWLKLVCAAAPATPFYYYNFPVITGVALDAAKLLGAVEAVGIPQFRGFKFTDFNLFAFECCVAYSGGAYEVCYGRDEAAVGGMATGATAHIGNGFCFMMGPFRRMREGEAAGRADPIDAAAREATRRRLRQGARPSKRTRPRQTVPGCFSLSRACHLTVPPRSLPGTFPQPSGPATWPRRARSSAA